ncbi:hypothetical protein BDZ94DRAFT_1020013 [Collybia nuda]|uniref:Uncharacterized protein n=1 Tax=Collybia nuda TaxID=64659 RepID=A0A9P5XZ59_9AGAR|nr:hypothetical protein BDZ94DRAFT_1020013 [Collybia nuda]
MSDDLLRAKTVSYHRHQSYTKSCHLQACSELETGDFKCPVDRGFYTFTEFEETVSRNVRHFEDQELSIILLPI